jgi:molecular chaperone DnaK
MDEKEVEKLVKEAEAKREEDKKKKEAVEARNIADSTIYQAEKMINDNKDKIEEADKKELEEKIANLKKALENPNATKEDLEGPTKELNDTMMKVGQKLHQA